MAWHKAALQHTIHYGPRVFLTVGSILRGARIRVRPLPDAPAMTGHTLAVCASAVFLGRTAATAGGRTARAGGAYLNLAPLIFPAEEETNENPPCKKIGN